MEIKLNDGQVALIDDADFPLVSGHKWKVMRQSDNEVMYAAYYERREGRLEAHLMHRHILGLVRGDGMVVDHVNRDGLDNRRENLRTCTRSENMHNQKKNRRNTSGFKGVYWSSAHRKWLSKIRINGKAIFLGCFNRPEVAYQAYCEASKKIHGEFGRIN